MPEYRCEQLIGADPREWEFLEVIRGSSPEAALESIGRLHNLPAGNYRCADADGRVLELTLDRHGGVTRSE